MAVVDGVSACTVGEVMAVAAEADGEVATRFLEGH